MMLGAGGVCYGIADGDGIGEKIGWSRILAVRMPWFGEWILAPTLELESLDGAVPRGAVEQNLVFSATCSDGRSPSETLTVFFLFLQFFGL